MTSVSAAGRGSPLRKLIGWASSLILFYFAITPLAVVRRTFGYDRLRLRRRDRSSYWIVREATPPPESLRDQF